MTRDALIAAQIDAILQREDWPTYSNRPADRGGATKGGITLATLSDVRGRKVSIAELQALTEGEARAIYRQRYIRPWEWVPDDGLFAVCLDYAVTSWHDDPTTALQIACGFTGRDIDGALGPKTRAAVLVHPNHERLRESVIGFRVRHMANLAINEPDMQAFIRAHPRAQIRNLRGWLARATSFLE
jgi:lysozyme family protein